MTWLLANWKIIAILGLVAFGGLLVHNYGVSRYNAGVEAERTAWQRLYAKAQERAREAERRLGAQTIRLNEAIRERDEARTVRQTQFEVELNNAPGFEERYSAYLSLRNSLRDNSTQHFLRARADYLSSIPSDPNPGPRSDRPELRVALARSGPEIHLAP